MMLAPHSSSPYAAPRGGSKRARAGRVARSEGLRARISSTRPAEVILFESPGRGGLGVVTALVDRRTGTLSLVGQASGLNTAEADELRLLARGPAEAPPLAEVELEVARVRLVRAILATRIAGGEVPAWLQERADLVGDPAHASWRVDDVYLCIACDQPLPVHEQLARAEARGDVAEPPRCPHCRGDSQAPDSEGEAWLGRAWLMIAAGLPRRALVCAARAEGLKLAPERLEGVRGAACMALADHGGAIRHLRAALDVEPEGARSSLLKGWLASASSEERSTRAA